MLSSRAGSPPPDTVALMALSHVLQDEDRAMRLLALTGLTPDMLRQTIAAPETQLAVLDFLAGHEADLIDTANGLNLDPQALVDARDLLARQTEG